MCKHWSLNSKVPKSTAISWRHRSVIHHSFMYGHHESYITNSLVQSAVHCIFSYCIAGQGPATILNPSGFSFGHHLPPVYSKAPNCGIQQLIGQHQLPFIPQPYGFQIPSQLQSLFTLNQLTGGIPTPEPDDGATPPKKAKTKTKQKAGRPKKTPSSPKSPKSDNKCSRVLRKRWN